MADYFINSDKGKDLANSMGAGEVRDASDGSTWIKNSDGSVTVWKNGVKMTGVVGESTPAEPVTPEYTPEQPTFIDTPVLDSMSQTAPSVQQDTVQTPTLNERIQTAREKAKEATSKVTEGLYTIGTELGKSYADQLQNAGDTKLLSDGYTLRRDEDGGYSASKNGQSVKVRIDEDAVRRDSLMNEAIRGAFSQNSPYTVGTEAGLDLLEQAKSTGSTVWAPDNSEWAYTGNGFTATKNGQTQAITVDKDAIRKAAQKKAQALPDGFDGEYRIGSADGVSWVYGNRQPGEMLGGRDDSLWIWEGPDNVVVLKGDKTYKGVIDREAAKRDAQQAAAPASSGTGSAGGLYSGGSGTYASSTSGTKKSAAKSAPASTGPDVATLRKKAASAQKDMADIARQISANKARGKSSGDLESKYTEAKSRYDTARAQINAASAELTLVKKATAPEIKAAAANGQTARDSYSVQYTDTPSRAEVMRSYQKRKEEAQKEARKNAWQSLPTVADADRFTINEAADAQTRGAEQQFFASARRELQQNAWRSLPTVKDADRFSIPSQTDSLIQQAITQRQSAAQPQTDKGIGGKLFTMLGAGLGQFNSSIANFADAAATTVETVESYLNGGFTKDGKFVKGDSAFTSSLLQPIHNWAKYTQRTSNSLNERSAANWSDTKAGSVANTIGTGVIAALPQAALALLTLGTSSAGTLTQASSGLAGSIETVMRRISSDPSYWLSFMQETGGNFAEAKGAGATDEQAILASTIAGLANAAIEVGGGLENNNWMNDGTLSALSKAKNLIKGAVEEGGEELIQNPITRAMQKLVYDGDREWLSLDNTAQGRDAVFNPYQSAEEFATGAAVGGILGAGNFALNRALGSRSQNQAQNPQLTQDEMLDASIQAALRGETLTGPAQAVNQNTQQMTQPAPERGAEGVITGGESSKSQENDMGAMRSQFESVPKQSQTQSNTIGSMEAEWNVPESQRTPIMYDTISEAKSLDNARLRLAQDYAGEMAELRGKHNWSGEEVDMSMTILDNYRRAAEQTGDWTEYSNWRKEFSAHGTAAGQALQAYAKYSRQTGGGIVADASAALERAAKKTNKAEIMNRVSALAQQYDAAVGTGQENAKVNVNDLVDIIKSASTVRQTGTLIGNKTSPIVNWAMNRIANYARAEAQSGGGKNLDFLKTFAADSIYNIAADTRTVSAGEKVKTVRRAGMLSKVATFMRNLVSNNVFDPVDSVARNISVPLDMLVSTITGTRSVAGDASWFSAAKRKGSMDGLARACMEVGLDVDTSGGAGKYENTANRTFKMSGGVFSKLMSVWEAYEGYTLNATDEFQKGGIEASVQKGIDRLYEKGKIKDDSLRDAGKQEALYRTFQDKNVLSDAAIGFRNALNKAHIGDVGAGDIVLPFAQVPSNLGARAIEYSPAGLLVSAADFVNMLDSAKKGNLTAAQQAKAVQGVGRALTGSGMIAIAAAGALRGWLKVTGDDEDKNKDALGKTHDLDGTQLNISAAMRDIRGESAVWKDGDTLLSIGFLDPLNAQLTTGALIADDIRSEDGVMASRVLGNSLSGALQSVLDTPVMSTFQDVATNYEYSDASTPGGKMLDAAQKYAANQLSSVIPNALRGIAQGLDDTERNAYSSDNVWQQAVDNAKASIPGLRETLPAKTDVWGNPVKNEGGVRNFMNRNINPGNITTYKTDAVSSEIEKISDATGNSLYPDRTAPRSVKVDGESVSLTFEQRSMYQKAYGDAYSAAVTALMNDKNYKAMPDNMKAEILKQAKDTAAESAKDSLGIGYEMKSSAQAILEKSGAERNNAMISAAVKAQHYLSDDTKKQLSGVENQYKGADYIGLSDELVDSAAEKANAYFDALEASKYGGKLTDTQKELAGKGSKELAQYFMEKAIESRYSDTNKNGTKADEYLEAYKNGEINDAVALAVLSDKEIKAYDRYGRTAKVTPTMALQAANAHAGIKEITDEDGKVVKSAESQFDEWLDKQKWTEDQKSAIRMGFYTDNTKTYTYLSEQLRKGNISASSAKSELTPSYQAGWSHNVKDTGAEIADYIDAIVEYEERPSEDERKAAGYKNAWTWFCDYLNSTDLTQEQKYAIAISMYDYGDSTKKKIWDRLR